MRKIDLLIADDHKIFRDGLASIIKRLPYINNIFHAQDGMEVMEMIDKERFDIILMDINMPKQNGIETTMKVVKNKKYIKVLALTMHDDEHHVKMMMDAGATGYLLKSADLSELDLAIQKVSNGQKYMSKEVNDLFYEKDLNSGPALNEREIAIMKLVCQEYATKEIAEILSVSVKTVELYRTRMLQKTNSKNTAGLVVYALKNGIYQPE